MLFDRALSNDTYLQQLGLLLHDGAVRKPICFAEGTLCNTKHHTFLELLAGMLCTTGFCIVHTIAEQ